MLAHPQETLREGPLRIEPLKLALEAGSLCYRADLLRKKFITAFRPDRLALVQMDAEVSVNRNGLLHLRSQMHFDALCIFVVSRFVFKGTQIEVGPEFTIDAGK